MKRAQPEPHTPMPHLLTLSERNTLSVTGVVDVENFDDTVVVAQTEQGELTVRGRELQVGRLDLTSGDLTLNGTVDSLTYSERRSESGGFFGKLFR